MSQLSWPDILTVALHLKVSEALLLGGHAWDAYRDDKPSRDLLTEFKRIAAAQLQINGRHYREPADVTSEGPAIDAYLRRIGIALKSAALLAAKSPEAKRLFDALIGVCRIDICHPCSGANACAWTRKSGADDQKRMTSGDCMRSVQELFAWVGSVVSRSYRLAGAQLKTKAPHLMTGQGSPNTDLGLAINASTHRGVARGTREVRMTFHPDSLWVPDYLSLAYVFAHECTAHVWCGVDIDAPAAAISTPFHDGWMDVVAAAILRNALNDATLEPPSYSEEIWTRTIDVRGFRLSDSHPSPPAEMVRWRNGARAFKTLHFLFVQTLGGESDESAEEWRLASTSALKTVIDLSLRINASGISHQQRAQFVRAILRNFARNGSKARSNALGRLPHVADLIQNFLHDHNETKFVRQFVALSP